MPDDSRNPTPSTQGQIRVSIRSPGRFTSASLGATLGETHVVLSHESAAALQRLGTIIPGRPTVTLLPTSGRSPHVTDIEVRRASLRDDDWAWLDVGGLKLPVTTPARTIVDLLLDNQEPSYIVRAANEALAERLPRARGSWTRLVTARAVPPRLKHVRRRCWNWSRDLALALAASDPAGVDGSREGAPPAARATTPLAGDLRTGGCWRVSSRRSQNAGSSRAGRRCYFASTRTARRTTSISPTWAKPASTRRRWRRSSARGQRWI